MSLVVERFLLCDSRASAINCHDNFGVENCSNSTRAQRRDAKRNGWVFRGGRDICPACQESERTNWIACKGVKGNE
jgi:hypothetical protein